MDNRPIGVFDSGIGGISLWRAIRSSLPNESMIYLGDGKNCPYGDKSADEVVGFAFDAVELLLNRGCKMIVVACNTATSTAISQLREAYPDIPFVGMEPAIKPACKQTKTGVVAVLATKRSLESELFAATQMMYASNVDVITHVGEGFVELVESGQEDSEMAYNIVKPIIDVITAKDVDKIVLGCTHYPFLLPPILKAINGRSIDVIDPSLAIVKRIQQLLLEFDIESSEGNIVDDDFISFQNQEYCNKLRNKALATII